MDAPLNLPAGAQRLLSAPVVWGELGKERQESCESGELSGGGGSHAQRRGRGLWGSPFIENHLEGFSSKCSLSPTVRVMICFYTITPGSSLPRGEIA